MGRKSTLKRLSAPIRRHIEQRLLNITSRGYIENEVVAAA